MRWIRKLDEDPMSAGLQPDHDERLAVRVDEVPWQVVDRDVQGLPWRDVESTHSKYRNDGNVFRPVLDEHAPV